MMRKTEYPMCQATSMAEHMHSPLHWLSRTYLLGSVAAVVLALTPAALAQDTSTGTQEPGTTAPAVAPSAPAEAPAQPAPAPEPSQGADQAAQPSQEADQAAQPEATPLDGQIVAQEDGTLMASGLIGQIVSSPDGEPLGEVTDLLLTKDNRLAGIVVNVGGILGFGGKEIAMDMARVITAETETGDQTVILDFTADEMELAPEFMTLADQRDAEEAERARQAQEQDINQLTQPAAPPPGSSTVTQ